MGNARGRGAVGYCSARPGRTGHSPLTVVFLPIRSKYACRSAACSFAHCTCFSCSCPAGIASCGNRPAIAAPSRSVARQSAAVHGITTEHAQEHGAPVRQVTYELASALGGLFADGVPVFAFNASYDFTVLDRELQRHELPPLEPFPVVDPLVLNKQADKYHKGKRTLGVLTEEYGVELKDAHTSAADCLATERLGAAMAGRFPQLAMPAGQLHEQQVQWAKEQAADLQSYFDRIGKKTTVNGEWPVRPGRAEQ